MNVIYLTTGRIEQDGSVYYPPLVKAQIESLAPFIDSHRVLVLYRTDPIFLFRFVIQLRKARRLEPTIIHAQYGALTAFAGLLGKRGSPLIISFGGSDVFGIGSNAPRYWLRNWVTRQLGWTAAWASAQLIVKSHELYDQLPAFLRYKANIIPNGVRLNIFSPSEKTACRKALGWDLQDKIVLFTPGRANNYIVKNSELAAKVMEAIQTEIPDVKMIFIINKSPDEVALMMNAADCILLTSRHEGSPNVVKEAMACNLPVVTVLAGDVKERLECVSPSFVVESREPAELAQAIVKILANPERSNGFDEIQRQKLSRESVAKRILEIYERASAGRVI